MTLLLATALFPVVLLGLSLGAGLLVDRASGSWLPGPIVPVVGLATLICAGQLGTYASATAPWTPAAFVVLALAGYVLARPRLRGLVAALRAHPSLVAGAAGTYLVAIAPVLLLGRPSLAGYLLDTNTGIHLAGADWLLSNGRDFSGLNPSSSYGMQVRAFFESNNYPSGGHVLLGALGALSPVRLTWLYQPFMASLLALVAPSAWLLIRASGLRGAPLTLATVLSSVPALVYALSLTGSLKELTALPLIMALGVLVVANRRWIERGPPAALPMGLLVGAGLAAVGIAFTAWALVSAAVLAVHWVVLVRKDRRSVLRLAGLAATGVAVALVTAPAITLDYTASTAVASSIASTADPGNLLQPLAPVQALGIWITGQYRLPPPDHLGLTYGLIGIAVLAALLGAAALARRRHWALLGWMALLAIMWLLLARRGTIWTDGKLILLMSPVVLVLVWTGIGALARERQRLLAVLLGLGVAYGVLSSDALQYRETNLAPTERFDELADVNDRFAGRGPTFLTDFDEFTLYELRDLDVSSPALGFVPETVGLAPGGYGQSVDPDGVPLAAFAGQRLLVQRRSPTASRPPGAFGLVGRSTFYDVWERAGDGPRILQHVGAGSARSAASVVPCDTLEQLGRVATRAGGRLRVAARPPVTWIVPGEAAYSANFAGEEGLTLFGPGRLDAIVRVARAGEYAIWLKGQIGRPLEVSVDGNAVGSAGQQSAGQGNWLAPLRTTLEAGTHRISVVRPGGSLRPGDKTTSLLEAIALAAPGDANDSRLRDVAPGDYRQLCGQALDWVEVVTPA